MYSTEFEAIERELLSHKVARRVVSLITEGKLKPGDPLPPERQLAEQLKVGRPAVREAVRALQMLNIVEVRQGKGTFVSSLEPSNLVEPFTLMFSVVEHSMVELFEARKILESGLAALAAERITAEQLVDLHRCIEEAHGAKDDPARFLELDVELHSRIVEAAGNQVLQNIMLSLADVLRTSRELTVTLPIIREHALAEHEQIVEALEARDAVRASAIMSDHLDFVLRTYIGLKNRDPEKPAT